MSTVPTRLEPRKNGDFYRQCWQRVLDNPKPQIVMIQAFNDYLEESAVWITDTSKLDDTQEKWTTSDGKLSPSLYWDLTKEYIAKLRSQPATDRKPAPSGRGFSNLRPRLPRLLMSRISPRCLRHCPRSRLLAVGSNSGGKICGHPVPHKEIESCLEGSYLRSTGTQSIHL